MSQGGLPGYIWYKSDFCMVWGLLFTTTEMMDKWPFSIMKSATIQV